MKHSDFLHDLIQSMSPSERRYFKVVSRVHEIGTENSYHSLFDALAEMDEYDEEALYKKISGTALRNQLPVVKNYLFHRLLTNLRTFGAEESENRVMRGMLDDIEILYKRSMISKCLQLIAKAEKYAEKYDLLSALAELKGWRVYISFTHSSKQKDDVQTLLTEQVRVHKMLGIELECRLAYVRIRQSVRAHGEAAGKLLLKELKEIMRNPVLQPENRPATFNAHLNYLRSYMLYSELVNKPEATLKYALQIADLVNRNAHISEFHPNYSLMAAQFVCLGYFYTGQLQKIKPLLDNVGKQPGLKNWEQNNFIRDKVLVFRFTAAGLYYLGSGLYLKGSEFYSKELHVLEKYASDFPAYGLGNIYVNAATAYLGSGDTGKCLMAVNEVLKITNVEYLPDYHEYARFLQIMVMIDKGNMEEVRSLIVNLELFLKKTKRKWPVEMALLSFMKSIAEISRRNTDHKKAGMDCIREINSIFRSGNDSGSLVKFMQPQIWIASKCENTTMEKLFEKYVLK